MTLRDVLSFVTGSSSVPPEGFPMNPIVMFINNQTLCTATIVGSR